MKNIYLVSMIAGIFVLLAGTFVYAHALDTENYKQNYNKEQVYDNEYMDQMHKQIISQIDDPELIQEMNEIHETCMGSDSTENDESIYDRDYMMGYYGMMGY